MKRKFRIVLAGILMSVLIGFGSLMLIGPDTASACSWGGQGGQGYVPQRRGNTMGPYAAKPSLTKEQAFDIVSSHVRKLNPDLKVGRVNDAGNFYEAEVLSSDNEVVQLMGVDKMSGRLMIIN